MKPIISVISKKNIFLKILLLFLIVSLLPKIKYTPEQPRIYKEIRYIKTHSYIWNSQYPGKLNRDKLNKQQYRMRRYLKPVSPMYCILVFTANLVMTSITKKIEGNQLSNSAPAIGPKIQETVRIQLGQGGHPFGTVGL